jgi:serine/threonine protein kinase
MAPSEPSFEDLLVAWLDAHERGDHDAVAGLQAAHPEHAAALQRAAARLARTGMLDAGSTASAYPELLGEFRLLQRLGSGGMGIVFLAEQTSLRRKVAVKLVRPELMLSPIACERFQREVATVAQLQHPGIVPVLAVGQHQGVPYFAMEYVAGCSLDEVLLSVAGRAPQTLDRAAFARAIGLVGNAPPLVGPARDSWWASIVHCIAAVAETVAYVHARGILHRDLKPSNVMVTPLGHSMLLDFGLAHSTDQAPLTRSGVQLGSVPYMSPEQLQGEALDERTDVYSLAVTLYQLLALRLPFQTSNEAELRAAIVSGRTAPLPREHRHLPRDLPLVVATAMDADRRRRYPSMAAFAADLRAVLAGLPVAARPLSLATRGRRWLHHHPFVAGAALAISLVVLALPMPIAAREIERSSALDQAKQLAEADLVQARRAIEVLREQANQLLAMRSAAATELWRQMIAQVNTLYADLATRHPGDAELCWAQTATECLLAEESRRAGDLPQARAHLEVARAASRRHPHPARPEARLLEAKVEGTAATLTFEAFDLEGAEQHATRRIAILTAVVAQAPEAAAVQMELAEAENDLANIRGCQHRRSDKIDLLLASLARKQRHLGTAPTPQARIAVAQQCNNLAEMIFVDPEALPEAEHLYHEALHHLQGLASPWQGHPDTRGLLSEVHCGLGCIASLRGDAAAAEQNFDTARGVMQELQTADPASLAFAFLIVRIEVEFARHRLHRGDASGSAEAARRALHLADAALAHGTNAALGSLRTDAERLLREAEGK